ncbi:hypothetical protein HY504_03640 [Candidatus Wolfebacteria bacterium]|nr:hypothetical protein [Candidatus Wolfebacteria bacterium]
MKHERLKTKDCQGQFLLEAMVALGIIIIGLLSIFAFIGRSLSLNRVVADQLTGSYLAAEGVEVVKNILDGNILRGQPWNSGMGSGNFELDYTSPSLVPDQGRRLSFDGQTGRWGYNAATPTNFSRTVRIRMIDSDEIRVNSIVRWASRGGNYTVDVEDHFYNWRR